MDFTLSDGSTVYLDDLCLHSILEYVLNDSVSLQSVACTSRSLNLATGAVAADGLFGCLKVRALLDGVGVRMRLLLIWAMAGIVVMCDSHVCVDAAQALR